MKIFKHEYFEAKKEFKLIEIEAEKRFATYFVSNESRSNCSFARLYDKDFNILKHDFVPVMFSLSPSLPLFISLLLERNKKQIKEMENEMEKQKRNRFFLLSELKKANDPRLKSQAFSRGS